MKILFVSSGNSKNGISSIVKNQGLSLQKQGIDLTYFSIIGKGVKGYLRNIKPLRNLLKKNNFDIVHAHYSMSAFVASLSGAKPLVVSLMGSDVQSDKFFIYLFNRLFWSKIIVKSKAMKSHLGIKSAYVVPNGVDFNTFKPMNKINCKKKIGWNISKKQILFAANPNRSEKNYFLAKSAFEILNNKDCELKVLEDIPVDQMPLYHNAADVVILTSLREGSPNVIKEAMACNRPVVATDVGDIKQIIIKTKGCFVTHFNEKQLANRINKALNISSTSGRIDIEPLRSDKIAQKIIDIYNN